MSITVIADVAGLQIIYTLDEVAFIQNLVFYIESAYRIPVSKKPATILPAIIICLAILLYLGTTRYCYVV